MKKRHPLLYVNLLAILLSVACNLGSHSKKIHTSDGTSSLDIEYKGELFFNTNGTEIDAISPGGYVEYKRDNKKIIARPDDSGTVAYKIYIDGNKLSLTDTAARQFFNEAMPEIADYYERY